jgi:hypothetical protein
LAEEETYLEKLVVRVLKPPKSFWLKLKAKPPLHKSLPTDAKRAPEQILPFQAWNTEPHAAKLGLEAWVNFLSSVSPNTGVVVLLVKQSSYCLQPIYVPASRAPPTVLRQGDELCHSLARPAEGLFRADGDSLSLAGNHASVWLDLFFSGQEMRTQRMSMIVNNLSK